VFIVVDNLPDQREQPSMLLLLLPFRLIVVSVAVVASRWEGGINYLISSQRRGIEKGGAPSHHCCDSNRNNRDHNCCPSHCVCHNHCNLCCPIMLGWSLLIKNQRPNFSCLDAREMIRRNTRKGNASLRTLRRVDSQRWKLLWRCTTWTKLSGKSGEGGSGVVHCLCKFLGGLRCEGTTCRGISTTAKKEKLAGGV
jgi:hypothetical protein